MKITRALAVLALLSFGCQGGPPDTWGDTPEGDGPRIVWDLYAEPLPDIPLPNDVATWPDPTSPSGFRLNVSLVVPTALEVNTREHFNSLDGWGTYAPISVAFEEHIDLEDLLERQGGHDNFHESDFGDHAIYVVDLETGIPSLVDLNGGNFYYSVTHTDQYYPNDEHLGDSNLLFETREEDTNGNGELDPGEDMDYDGVLDHPNTLDGQLTGDPLETYDRMAWFYERETKTLVLRPILPLRQNTRYAVVITDRLIGENGESVRSPFANVHHVRQTEDLASLPDHFAAHPELYGDLSTRGWDGVAFAWSFTTQSITHDLDTIRDGLYGRGVMSYLQEDFPTDVMPAQMQGGRDCPDPGAGTYYATGEQFRTLLRTAAVDVFGLNEVEAEEAVQTYSTLGHIVTTFFETPYFFGDPDDEQLEDAFQMDYTTGEARVTRELISMTMFIPEEGPDFQQPFDPFLYVHGHGSSNAEILLYGGLLLQHGNALVVLNAHGHGAGLSRVERLAVGALFDDACISPTADAMLASRARDLDGDGDEDSGAHFWTAYVFHVRDSVRQTVIDHQQAIRILRSYDGEEMATPMPPVVHPGTGREIEFDGDFDRDGVQDLAGDFDGNGVPDIGGPAAHYAFAGGSLGGITTGTMVGAEPAIDTAIPVVGAGGLSDVAIRTENGSVVPAMILRVMGPLVMGVPSGGPTPDTSCAEGDVSLHFLATSLTSAARTEFACVPGSMMAEEDLLLVRNLANDEIGCGGTIRGAGNFRVPIPSDAGDEIVVELYRGGRDLIHYGDCEWFGDAPEPDLVVDTFEIANGTDAGTCANCARYEDTTWDQGATLVAPTAGFGRRRQTPDFRRLIMLAQIALDPADPINYAARVFLDPVTAPDVATRPRNILSAQTTGDPNVNIAAGNTFARAAGVLPFLPPDAPEVYAEFRASAEFGTRYPGMPTPNDVLREFHVLEGIPRLQRHPVPGGEEFLADVDDFSDGLNFYAANGTQQLPPADGGVAPVVASPPLRFFRQSRRMTSPTDDVWSWVDGQPHSGVLNAYVIPRGIHGFNVIFDPTIGFDNAVYLFNTLGRYVRTHGTDLPYVTDPMGHHCQEDSSCSYIRRPAIP